MTQAVRLGRRQFRRRLQRVRASIKFAQGWLCASSWPIEGSESRFGWWNGTFISHCVIHCAVLAWAVFAVVPSAEGRDHCYETFETIERGHIENDLSSSQEIRDVRQELATGVGAGYDAYYVEWRGKRVLIATESPDENLIDGNQVKFVACHRDFEGHKTLSFILAPSGTCKAETKALEDHSDVNDNDWSSGVISEVFTAEDRGYKYTAYSVGDGSILEPVMDFRGVAPYVVGDTIHYRARRTDLVRGRLLEFVVDETLISPAHEIPTEDVPPGPRDEGELEAAIHEILNHNDLSDLEFVSSSLGLALQVRKPVSESQKLTVGNSTNVLPTANPTGILATGISYTVEPGRKINSRGKVVLRFIPRACPPISIWAKKWHVAVENSELTDSDISFETIHFNGATGIALAAIHGGGASDGCELELTQDFDQDISFPIGPAVSADAGAGLLQEIVELLREGDLRDYKQIGSILRTKFIVDPWTLRGDRLYFGGATMDRIVPGIRTDNFNYSVNDAGWSEPAVVLVLFPPHLQERNAQLEFLVDTGKACINEPQVEAALTQQSVAFSVTTIAGGTSIQVVRDNSAFTLKLSASDKCVDAISITQVIDLRRRIPIPFMFRVSSSDSHSRSNAFDALVARLRDVRLEKIEISAHLATTATSSERSSSHALAKSIWRALLDRKIDRRVVLLVADHAEEDLGRGEAFVSIDVSAAWKDNRN